VLALDLPGMPYFCYGFLTLSAIGNIDTNIFTAVLIGLLTLGEADSVPNVFCFRLLGPSNTVSIIHTVAVSVLVMGNIAIFTLTCVNYVDN